MFIVCIVGTYMPEMREWLCRRTDKVRTGGNLKMQGDMIWLSG